MQFELEVSEKRKNHEDAQGNAVMMVTFKQKGGMGSLHLYLSAAEARQYELDDVFLQTLERKPAPTPEPVLPKPEPA